MIRAAVLFVLFSCSVSFACVDVKIAKAGFVNKCRQSPCIYLEGAGVITNNCSYATGVELRLVGVGADGQPVKVQTFWPASDRNIPLGEYPFSLDQVIDYHPDIKQLRLTVEQTRVWQK